MKCPIDRASHIQPLTESDSKGLKPMDWFCHFLTLGGLPGHMVSNTFT